ncbi:hypothetical protein SNE40_020061 [Patella caerulea]|uniref:Biogenesis of lysosome-related organelles complex 1 subunit 3 n=1 Tax=Patella caerulea TaxID=87958 RepID=A0AAN8G6T3_PATCE
MSNREEYRTVVQGEASESDEETPKTLAAGIVVSGEASESEEEIDTAGRVNADLPPIIVAQRSISLSSDAATDIPTLMTSRAAEAKASKPKYDTLLHRKLRDSNLNFHSHLVDNCSQTYLAAARNLHSTTSQLNKSHSAVQDASHNLRLLTNDLFHLEDKVDIICSCKLLPDIIIATNVL